MNCHVIRSILKTLRRYCDCVGQAVSLLLTITLVSCGAGPTLQQEVQQGQRPAAPLKYSLIFFIHGDGDYLYHDANGIPREADEVTVSKARESAEAAFQAEVFIFHEEQKRHALLFFPQRDGEFFYYRNGRLEVRERYWRDDHNSYFGYETDMYRRLHASDGQETKTIVLYFGHEIPEFEGEGYNASHADLPFTVDTLAACLRQLQGDQRPFDLVVLSTCYNGTPHTISAIAPYTRYIIASPDNLHLSYFSVPSFGRSDSISSNETTAAFAKQFARAAFDTLAGTVFTTVSVAVYDASLVQAYFQSVDTVYKHSLSVVKEYPAASREHCDCAGISEFVRPEMSRGVEVYYRPPRFGQSQHISNHSGWECWKITKSP
jgi:hypothetical protein